MGIQKPLLCHNVVGNIRIANERGVSDWTSLEPPTFECLMVSFCSGKMRLNLRICVYAKVVYVFAFAVVCIDIMKMYMCSQVK